MGYPLMPALPISMAKGLKKTPHFNTVSQKTAAGMTSSVSLMPYPTWDFEFDLDAIQGNEALASSVLAQFMSIYMATSGGAGLFLFRDPQDFTVTASQFGVGDGTTTSFQLSRTINGAQDIIQNWIASPSAYVNGVLSTTALISNTGVVVFATAPATGAVLTVTGTFYFLCRFAEDTIDAVRSFTRNSGVDLWSVSSIKFSSEYVSALGSGTVGVPGSGITYTGTSGVTIPVVSTTLPIVDGTASIGTTGKYADAGHVHPTDTSRQAALGFSPVANTTTVNGHALSSNVTVSASDITTGTLPSAQLPAIPFSAITGSTNISAAMVVGSGASIASTGTGILNANQVNGAAIPSSAPLLGTNSGGQPISVTTVPAANLPKATTAALGAIHLPSVTTFTSGSGTYTTSAGATMLHIRLVGGGGGGVGSGSSVSNGSAGNTTSFGTSFLTANGGGAGTGQAGGVAGTASGGAINITGGDGGSARALSSTALFEPGGLGGASAFGGGGAGGSQSAGNTGKAYGSGGGGGGIGTSTAYPAAGGGAGGFVEAWVTSPSATYTYSVGTGGTGGAAGTNGYAGGTGAAGIIIIEAY